jgi:hypothetical protein
VIRLLAAALIVAIAAGAAEARPKKPPERVCTYAAFWDCADRDGE